MRKRTSWIRGKWTAMLGWAGLAAVAAGCGGGGPISLPLQPGQPAIPAAQDLSALLPPGQRQATLVGSDKCGECHGAARPSLVLTAETSRSPRLRQQALEDLFTPYHQTTHFAQGVGCESCHGPGSEHVASNGDRSKILTFPNIASPLVCAQCHAGIHQEWLVSKHDEVVDAVVQRARTTPQVYARTCFRCHSGLFRTQIVESGKNPNTLTNEELLAFVDPTDNTAACVTCHNPHRKTGNLNDDGKEVQLRQAVFNTNTAQVGPGASVDQYTTFNHICAKCHNGRGANPSDAALQAGTARPNMHDSNQFNMLAGFGGAEDGAAIRSDAHFNIQGQCTSCHMIDGAGRHTYVVKLDNCLPCHTIADAAARRNAVTRDIEGGLLALRARLQRWAQDNFGDPQLWDYTSIVQEEGKTPPNQAQVPIQIKRARHNYYFVLRDNSLGVHNGRYARYLLEVANRQLDTLNVPRQAVLASRVPGSAVLEEDRRRATRADLRETPRWVPPRPAQPRQQLRLPAGGSPAVGGAVGEPPAGAGQGPLRPRRSRNPRPGRAR